MSIRSLFVVVAVTAATLGCDDGKAKIKEAGKKVDKALDNLEVDEVARNLVAAKDSIAKGQDAATECSWAASFADATAAEASRAQLAELRRLCTLEVPLARATRAVTLAEKARAEIPEAPSLTECSSDEWPKAKQRLDQDHPGEPRWTALVERWKKVCPGA